jgi:hypothetical protein
MVSCAIKQFGAEFYCTAFPHVVHFKTGYSTCQCNNASIESRMIIPVSKLTNYRRIFK